MSGGEPSSIKQKPSCAAELQILSPKCGKAAGCVYSNYLCAVLWGAERFSIETTLSIEFRRKTAPCRHIFLPLCISEFMNLLRKFYFMRAAARSTRVEMLLF